MANSPIPAPPKAPAPASAKPATSPTPKTGTVGGLAIEHGVVTGPQKLLVYGSGGIGKSTLCAALPSPLFLDLEQGTRMLDVARVSDIEDWEGLRSILASIASSPPEGIKSIVIDSATKAEAMAAEEPAPE